MVGMVAGCATSSLDVALSSNSGVSTCGPALLGQRDTNGVPRWIKLSGHQKIIIFVSGQDTAVAGGMTDVEQDAVFVPAFPLTPGLRYRVASIDDPKCNTTFEVASAQAARLPRLLSVHPAASLIPENVLRFYLYFSEPMAEGSFLEHVRLIHDNSGADLTGVFFDNIYELWSPDRQRITLLVDPGRVKTGLAANARLGRAFRAGERYTLEVRPTWKSIAGQPLAQGYRHHFKAGPEDRSRVEPTRWRFELPTATTREPLGVRFGESVDHVSVGNFLAVLSPDDTPIHGTWHSQSEVYARFVPLKPWRKNLKAYRLAVHARFEDIAGNNINAALDHQPGEVFAAPGAGVIVVPLGVIN